MIKGFLAGVGLMLLVGFAWLEADQLSFESRLLGAVPSVTALCRDGTYSTSDKKRGQCSSHDGVEKWIIREAK